MTLIIFKYKNSLKINKINLYIYIYIYILFMFIFYLYLHLSLIYYCFVSKRLKNLMIARWFSVFPLNVRVLTFESYES